MVENTSAGAGSIWNKNSWHWEDKNYSKVAEDFLRARIPQVTVQETNPPCTIQLYDLKTIKGSAQVTIRKQKSIFLFEYDLDIYFRAVSEGEDKEEAKGLIHLKELNQDDEEFEVTCTCENPSDFATLVRKAIQKNFHRHLLTLFKDLKAHCLQ